MSNRLQRHFLPAHDSVKLMMKLWSEFHIHHHPQQLPWFLLAHCVHVGHLNKIKRNRSIISKRKFTGTKKKHYKSTCLLGGIMTIGERLKFILQDEAFVVKSTHDTFVDLSDGKLMMLRLILGHVLTNVSSWRRNIIEKIVVKGFFHALLDTFRTLFDPTFIFDAIEFGAKTSGFQHDFTIHFIFHCEWYFFVCRNEQFVILGIIRQIDQMLERLDINVEIIGFYSIQQRIGVFVHDIEAISKLGCYFIIMKFV